MDLRVGAVLPSVLVIICLLSTTRSLMASDISAPVELQEPIDGELSKAGLRNEQTCTFCEEYAAQVLQYLSSSETQFKITSFLHEACSELHTLKHQCVSLVDYYAPLFFTEIITIQPELFCEKVSLCELLPIRIQKRDDACTVCQSLLSEVRAKLQDPDTELDIIQTLLKVCNKVENFAQECKRLVFEFGPIILADAGKFIETTDICVAAHICRAKHEAIDIKELHSSA